MAVRHAACWDRFWFPRTGRAGKPNHTTLVQDLTEKKLYDDPADVDPVLWETLRRADPQAISRNAQVRYDEASSAYLVPFLDGEFACLPSKNVSPSGSGHAG